MLLDITPSHDLETEIENHKSISGINENEVNQVVSSFMGVNYKDLQNILQSRLMEKEHMNLQKEKNVLIKEKEIIINELKILNFSSPVIEFYISCSKGTYIRSIARDLGEKLGCGAYLSELRRTKIGSFCVDNADTIEELEQKIK